MWKLLISIILSACANGAVLTSDAPATTPRALLPRGDSVFGYYSNGKTGSETIWNAYLVDTDQYSFTTSGDYYRFCSKGSACYMAYSCSSGYIIYESSSTSRSSYCGLYTSACSYHLLYSSFGDYDPMTQYWCLESGYTGLAIYQTTPEVTPTPSDTPTIPLLSGPTITATPPPTQSPTVVSGSTSSKSNTGIIVGGVVGGIALIGIIALVAIFLLRRKRAYHTAHQPAFQGHPQMISGLPEKTAQPTTIAVDPHASTYYGSGTMSPVTPASPAPQYAAYTAPHRVELSSERV